MSTLVEETKKPDMDVAEKKKKKKKQQKKESNSSSLIPGQSDIALRKHIRKLKAIHAAYEKMNSPPSGVSPSVDLPKTQSSQVTEDESTSTIFEEYKFDLDEFFNDLFKSDSTAARVVPYHEKTPSSVSPSDSVRSDSSSFIPSPRTQRSPLCVVSPRRFGKNDWSVLESRDSHLQKRKCESLQETYSTASTVSVRSESSMYEPPSFHLQRGQSEPLRETDSVISSVSMTSDSSMYEPPSFHLKRKQSQLTEEISSCSVCEEAVKDPVRLLCGHRSCKQCVLSFWEQKGSTAYYSCKKCGRRSETDQDLQSVLLQKKIKRCEMETEKFQAEKEKFELEKKKLALEIELLAQKGKYTN